MLSTLKPYIRKPVKVPSWVNDIPESERIAGVYCVLSFEVPPLSFNSDLFAAINRVEKYGSPNVKDALAS